MPCLNYKATSRRELISWISKCVFWIFRKNWPTVWFQHLQTCYAKLIVLWLISVSFPSPHGKYVICFIELKEFYFPWKRSFHSQTLILFSVKICFTDFWMKDIVTFLCVVVYFIPMYMFHWYWLSKSTSLERKTQKSRKTCLHGLACIKCI